MGKSSFRKFAGSALSLFMAVLFVFTSLPSAKVNAASVTISQTSATIEVGSTLQLTVYVDGAAATASAWGSSDSDVATVSSSGLVTGKLAGSCFITALVNGTTVDCQVSVVKKSTTGTVRYNVLIMDTSGSVRGTPLKREKTAAKRFCKTILNSSGANYVAVIAMNSKATKICDFTSDYTTAANKISAVSASGETNINAAIALAGSMLDKASFSGSNVMKNIIICSDGLPTAGTKLSSGRYTSSNHSKAYKYANKAYKTDVKYKNKGYFVYALGFFHNSTGKDLTFGKQLMKDLASKDKYYIITDSSAINTALNKIATAITTTTINKTSASIKVGGTVQLNTYVDGVQKTATWKTSNSAVATVSSSGLVTGKKAGTCTITASVGSAKATCTVTVKNPKCYEQTGYVSDASNGSRISGATVYAYIGYNSSTSGVLYASAATDSNGRYSIKLPKGKFTLITKKSGYITADENYQVTGADTSYTHQISLSQKLSNTTYRIVLTWGSTPNDLDSHLFGPTSSSTFHVYYSGKSCYNLSASKYLCQLDVDDRSAYGPETITLDLSAAYVGGGTYKYYIKDFTNRSSTSSTALANSGATVTVYKGNTQVAKYYVPNKAGTYWHVFDIVDGSIKKINTMSYYASGTEFNF